MALNALGKKLNMGQINKFASTACPLFGQKNPLGLAPVELFDFFAPVQIGVYGAAHDIDTAQNAFAASGNTIPLRANLTSSVSDGNAYGAHIYLKQTADTTGSPRTLTLWCNVSHPTGTTCLGGNALHANSYLDTGCTGVSGEMHAAASHLIVAEEARTIQGTYCAHKFVNEFETGAVMPGSTTFFARFHDAGAVNTPYLFQFVGLETAADDATVLFRTGGQCGNGDEITAGLKCMVNGAVYYIALIATGDWSD